MASLLSTQELLAMTYPQHRMRYIFDNFQGHIWIAGFSKIVPLSNSSWYNIKTTINEKLNNLNSCTMCKLKLYEIHKCGVCSKCIANVVSDVIDGDTTYECPICHKKHSINDDLKTCILPFIPPYIPDPRYKIRRCIIL